MTVIRCDKCKKESDKVLSKFYVPFVYGNVLRSVDYDLCLDCSIRLADTIQRFFEK